MKKTFSLELEEMADLMAFIRISREHVAPGIPRFDEAYEKAFAVFWDERLLAKPISDKYKEIPNATEQTGR